MSVLSAIAAELAGVDCRDWERETALALAAQMDEAPNASLSKELRLLMAELGADRPVESGDVADDLAAKREERRRRAASS